MLQPEIKVGIFYASTTGHTEEIAHRIAQFLGRSASLHDIAREGVAALPQYRYLILGIPTWDFGQKQENWAEHWAELEVMDFHQVKVVLFGLGDQIGYGEWFVDALADLADLLQVRGAELLVPWSVEGYSFEASRALTEDGQHFVGLALDQDCQAAETDERLHTWLSRVCHAFQAG
ncbi:flavodoxin [Nitrincola tapanii]|uniref:Flavodoxin n=1 Tax=Nitrincola tapanii TaxID=1708751 RepID=A0A5A9W3F5_9GAMM|nr:flavodoxin [Nitrincola tapanii]KAA0874729.1 flavodoxin [Nitrincola tapanii]